MNKVSPVTKLMFGIIAVLLIITVILGIITVVKDGKRGKDPDKTVLTGTPVPTSAVSGTPTPEPTVTPTPTPTKVLHKIALDAGQQLNEDKKKEAVGPGSSDTVNRMSYGATSVTNKMREYEWNLIMTKLVKDELVKRGYEVYMIRETHDVNISNSERALKANESGAEIFVGIQADSSDTPGVSGAYAQAPKSSNKFIPDLYSECRSLAETIMDEIKKTTERDTRGIIESNNVAEINYSKIPVTILQLGYMSNAEEDALLQTDSYRQKLCKAICDGIDKYFANKTKVQEER